SYLPHIAAVDNGWPRIALLLATGVSAGFLSGMMGVGGGTIMVPAMVLLLGFGQHTAQGTSLLAMVPAGASGAYTHGKLGNIAKNLLPGLIPGILIGTYLGGTLAHVLAANVLRFIFASILVWIGMRYLMTKRPASSPPRNL
ncbi:MAG TPA: sulfite exporter TauE/SafE family protein, partial [Nitrospirota bacterium]|nr:sulfite exporter TauE/SafE family protein [Nitrospirota bacterium]